MLDDAANAHIVILVDFDSLSVYLSQYTHKHTHTFTTMRTEEEKEEGGRKK